MVFHWESPLGDVQANLIVDIPPAGPVPWSCCASLECAFLNTHGREGKQILLQVTELISRSPSSLSVWSDPLNLVHKTRMEKENKCISLKRNRKAATDSITSVSRREIQAQRLYIITHHVLNTKLLI